MSLISKDEYTETDGDFHRRKSQVNDEEGTKWN